MNEVVAFLNKNRDTIIEGFETEQQGGFSKEELENHACLDFDVVVAINRDRKEKFGWGSEFSKANLHLSSYFLHHTYSNSNGIDDRTRSFRSKLFLLKPIGKLAKRVYAKPGINAMKCFPSFTQNIHVIRGVLVNRG